MEPFIRAGIPVVGLDGCAQLIQDTESCTPKVAERMSTCDLRAPGWWRPWTVSGGWDLVLCVEVAEHLEEQHAAELVRGLCRLGDRVFFSSARVGQKGLSHVNCQPKRYWIDLFEAEGFGLRMDWWRQWHDQLKHRGKRYGANIRRNAVFFSRRANR